ncbi:hypothetical protein TNCV_502121 [Trichonephila clavipes]|nr:hypothetical protein TNCV_502121 [Trichonephila clavipes]
MQWRHGSTRNGHHDFSRQLQCSHGSEKDSVSLMSALIYGRLLAGESLAVRAVASIDELDSSVKGCVGRRCMYQQRCRLDVDVEATSRPFESSPRKFNGMMMRLTDRHDTTFHR